MILKSVLTKNWCSLLRTLLCNLGFHDVWMYQTIGNIEIFLSHVKQRIKDQFLQSWNEHVTNSSRGVFYSSFSSFCFQPYLHILQIDKFRNAVTKLRVSSHRLCIETGRWAKPNAVPLNQRLCTTCNLLEDEFHFVCECNLFSDLRRMYIPRYYRVRPSMQKFMELLKSDRQTLVNNLSVYVYKAFELRNNVLYQT